MTVQELQDTVAHLSDDDLATFSEWFEEFMAEQWDRQFESDVRAGRLDAAGRRADADFEAGRYEQLIAP
jgi:hypothetical protein